VLAATSDHVEYPLATAVYYGSLVAASLLVGQYWLLRVRVVRSGRCRHCSA
jgi:hypothetical protein